MASIFNFINYKDFLRATYKELKKDTPNMSLEKFAATLGFSSSNLKMILTGKRKLSVRYIYQISKKLKLTKEESTYLEHLVLIDMQKVGKAKAIISKKNTLLKDQNRLQSVSISKKDLLADPFILPIMVYLTDIKKIRDFDANYSNELLKDISEKFKLEKSRCLQILKIIESANIIELKGKNKEVHYIYSNITNVLSQKQYLKNWLELSKQELESRYHEDTTLFNTTSLSLTKEQSLNLKNELKITLEKYMSLNNDDNKNLAITQVNIQLFSLID